MYLKFYVLYPKGNHSSCCHKESSFVQHNRDKENSFQSQFNSNVKNLEWGGNELSTDYLLHAYTDAQT